MPVNRRVSTVRSAVLFTVVIAVLMIVRCDPASALSPGCTDAQAGKLNGAVTPGGQYDFSSVYATGDLISINFTGGGDQATGIYQYSGSLAKGGGDSYSGTPPNMIIIANGYSTAPIGSIFFSVSASANHAVTINVYCVPKSGTAPVAVTTTMPNAGPTIGGTRVLINGANLSGVTAVKFGSTNATSFTINCDTSITATSPAGSGTVDVTTATSAGTNATRSGGRFTYGGANNPPPTVTSVLPIADSGEGSAGVIIVGTNFTGADAVNFCGANATSFFVNSANVITATVPTGRGTVDVTVTTPGGTSSTSAADQYTFATTNDFNGDGKADILWRGSDGKVAIWAMNGGSALSSVELGVAPPNWEIIGQRDFNGDTYGDILWRNPNGGLAIWFVNGLDGTQVVQSVDFGNVSPAWSIVGTGDFNGDGLGDILWINSNGDTALWLMKGSEIAQNKILGKIPSNWSVASLGDFDGDGKTDVLWRSSSGDVAIWFMNGLQVMRGANIGNVSTVWATVGTGDFNGDGMADILWRSANGDVAIWLMNGSQVLQAVDIGNVSTIWAIAEIGDFNGDGMCDILWRDSFGEIAIWFMNGAQLLQSVDIGNVPNGWSIQGADAGR